MFCTHAINFFSVMTNHEMCEVLSIENEPNKTYPLSDFDFLKYLKKTNLVPDPWRYFQSISSLLKKMERVGILESVGKRNSANCYYFQKELTQQQRKSWIWLIPVIGVDSLLHILSPYVVQITGKISEDVHAGSAFL